MLFVYILASVILIYCVILYILVHKFAYMILKPATHSHEAMLNECLEQGRLTKEYLDSLNPQPIEINSRYGYVLKGVILDNEVSKLPENKERVAVLCHGYTATKLSMFGYARRLMDLGFTCVIYDHRNHGDTGKVAYTSMSYYEKFDLSSVIDFCYDRFGQDIRILTYGESMGSAIVLSELEIDTRPVMTIADCGYSDLYNLCSYLLGARFNVPKIFPVLPFAAKLISKEGEFDIRDVSPRRGVSAAKTPILFCHGKDDDFIPCTMSEEMSKMGNGIRKLYLCEGARHAMSEVKRPEEYTTVISDFIKSYY